MLGLELAQLDDQQVVLGVGDLGRVEHVVQLVVVPDQPPQFLGPGRRVRSGPCSPPCQAAMPAPTTASGSAGVVEGHGLARSDGSLRRVEPHHQPRPDVVGLDGARDRASVRADLRHRPRAPTSGSATQVSEDSGKQTRGARPPRPRRPSLAAPPRRRASRSVACPSPPWPMPRRCPTVTSSTASTLPGRVALCVDDLTRVHRHPLLEEALPALHAADEAHILAVGLHRRTEPEPARVRAHLGLGHLPHREQDARELVLAQHRQDIGLVLGGIGAPSQLGAVRPPVDAGRGGRWPAGRSPAGQSGAASGRTSSSGCTRCMGWASGPPHAHRRRAPPRGGRSPRSG